jgi:hypothetical protein
MYKGGIRMQEQPTGLRLVTSQKWEFNADAKSVFLLLCPTKENDWIEDWEQAHKLIYSESGIAEDACVFTTNMPGEGYAVWLTSKYSLDNTYIEFVKHLVEKEVVIRWKMEVRPLSSNTCTVFIIYNATGLSEKGNNFVQTLKDSGFTNLMARLEELISYYLLTGKMKQRA